MWKMSRPAIHFPDVNKMQRNNPPRTISKKRMHEGGKLITARTIFHKTPAGTTSEVAMRPARGLPTVLVHVAAVISPRLVGMRASGLLACLGGAFVCAMRAGV